jgi:hypothetical protein
VPGFHGPLDYNAIYRRDVPITHAAQMRLAEIKAVCVEYRAKLGKNG